MHKVRQLRLQKGLTQLDLARRAGVSQASLSDIETGKCNPTVRMLVKVARALGVAPSELLDDDSPATCAG